MASASARLPPITEHDVSQFAGPVVIRDAKAFADKLQEFVEARLDAAIHAANLEVAKALASKAAHLRAGSTWTPGATEVQRGRTIMMTAFNQPTNLPLREFAALAGKSRQQIYRDIDARRLLALNVGPRGQRLPDWQLDDVKRRLTQHVLVAAEGVDDWTVYRALSQPLEGLGGRAPIDAVTADSVERTAGVVVNVLGL